MGVNKSWHKSATAALDCGQSGSSRGGDGPRNILSIRLPTTRTFVTVESLSLSSKTRTFRNSTADGGTACANGETAKQRAAEKRAILRSAKGTMWFQRRDCFMGRLLLRATSGDSALGQNASNRYRFQFPSGSLSQRVLKVPGLLDYRKLGFAAGPKSRYKCRASSRIRLLRLFLEACLAPMVWRMQSSDFDFEVIARQGFCPIFSASR
jgi:hypothetical protein